MPIQSRRHILRFYATALAVVMVFAAFEALYVAKVSFAEEEIGALSPLQDKQLGIFVEMNHLLSTLATASLAAMGAFLFHRYKASDPLPLYQLWRAIGSCVFSGLSLYCGYLSYDKVVWMLDQKFFNLFNPRILWPGRIQFWAFVVSVFFIADFIFGALRKEES
jgi:hypothetical protein